MFSLLKNSYLCEFIAVVCSTCVTDVIIYPLTTSRIRLQMERNTGAGESISPLSPIVKIAKNEGVKYLYSGIKVSFLRLLSYHGIRIAMMYSMNTSIEDKIPPQDIFVKNTTNITALVLVQPIIVAKVRYQARIYEPSLSMKDAFQSIYQNEGVHGLFRGVIPNCVRTLVSHCFDQRIRFLMKYFVDTEVPWPAGIQQFVISTAIYSFVMTVLTNPFDVTRNRYINDSNGEYKNVYHCFLRILRKEGPIAFLRGFKPYFFSAFISNLILMYIYEQTKSLLKSLQRFDR